MIGQRGPDPNALQCILPPERLALASPSREEDRALFAILKERFPFLRSFAAAVLEALSFEAAPANAELLAAIDKRRACARRSALSSATTEAFL